MDILRLQLFGALIKITSAWFMLAMTCTFDLPNGTQVQREAPRNRRQRRHRMCTTPADL